MENDLTLIKATVKKLGQCLLLAETSQENLTESGLGTS